MNKNRFHTTGELSTEIIDKLELLGFSKLPNCMSKPYAHLKKTIIDTKTKTFWCLDQVCFENSVVTISNQFQEIILEFNIDDLVFNEAKELDLSNETSFKKPHKATETQEITLLDYFAAKAMQGELSNQDENTSFRTSGVSQRAYQIAREMMEIRGFGKYNVK
jgi:hypothetical protein